MEFVLFVWEFMKVAMALGAPFLAIFLIMWAWNRENPGK